jgi:hypothetical protein
VPSASTSRSAGFGPDDTTLFHGGIARVDRDGRAGDDRSGRTLHDARDDRGVLERDRELGSSRRAAGISTSTGSGAPESLGAA